MNYKKEINPGGRILKANGERGIIDAELQPGSITQNGDKRRFFSIVWDNGTSEPISESDIRAYFFDESTELITV